MKLLAGGALALTLSGAAMAGEVSVVDARASPEGGGRFTFHVTLAHEDEGWEHYADKWEVLGPDGAVLGVRVLLHPHENEQPFTRQLSGVEVPEGTAQVMIRAHDKVHGDGPELFTLDLGE